MRTNDDRGARAKTMRAAGATWVEIAAALGVSKVHARYLGDEAYAERSRRQSRAAKARRAGVCKECGAPTRYGGRHKHGPVGDYCHLHAYVPAQEANTKWTRENIVERIQQWNRLYGSPPTVADWNPNKARHVLGDELRAQRFETDSMWPWFSSVFNVFGSWNAAIEAAGFEPNEASGAALRSNSTHRRRRGVV